MGLATPPRKKTALLQKQKQREFTTTVESSNADQATGCMMDGDESQPDISSLIADLLTLHIPYLTLFMTKIPPSLHTHILKTHVPW